MTLLADHVWRDFTTDGVPTSGKHEPIKAEIREWGAYVEGLAGGGTINGKVYTSRTALYADLSAPANTPAIVASDPLAGRDGLYVKVGAANAGSWTQLSDYVPGSQVITAIDVGAGTPNAIQATTTIPVGTANQLIVIDLFETNGAGAVTIQFNGGTIYPVKTASGADPATGALPSHVIGSISQGQFILLSDMASPAIQTAAANSATAAAASAASAASFAGSSYGVNLGSPVVHATNFTVGALDFSLLHILEPSLGQTLEVTLPPAASNVGKVVAFSVPHGISGLVQFKATAGQVSSLISDYTTDDFFIWQKETITLIARSDRWLILDWRKNPFFLQADLPATDINLTAGGSDLLTGWVGTNYAGTYLRHSVFGLSGGNVVLPRRGGYLFEVDIFCNWTGTPPIYLYTEVDTSTGGIAGRGYADFIQSASPTQANINWRKCLNGGRNTVVSPRIYCGTGSTTPRIFASAAQPRLRLTEMF